MVNRWETMETVACFILEGGSKIVADADSSHEIKRHLLLGRKAMTNLESTIKSRDIILPTKVHLVKAMVLPVVMCWWLWMWELDHKEGWAPKNWCFWTVLEKTLESPLDCKIKPVNPKGNQPWIFTGRTDAKGEGSILWPPDEKSWLIGKDSDAGKDRRQGQKGTTEDEMVGWHHWLNGYEFELCLGDGEGQGRLVCCSPWGLKELDVAERLNNTNLLKTSKLNLKHLKEPGFGQDVSCLFNLMVNNLFIHLGTRSQNKMASYSSVLAWRIPGTGEPGGLPSMGSHRVGHDWSDLAVAAAVRIRIFSILNDSIYLQKTNKNHTICQK